MRRPAFITACCTQAQAGKAMRERIAAHEVARVQLQARLETLTEDRALTAEEIALAIAAGHDSRALRAGCTSAFDLWPSIVR